jgi:hypothetical protein
MKKSILLATLGLTTSVVSSYGTGYVYFSSYNANLNNPSFSADSPTAITTLYASLYYNGSPIGKPFQADLYYSLGAVADPVNLSSVSSIISIPTGLTDLGVFSAYANSGITAPNSVRGYFDDLTPVTIPGYTGGQITFEVVAFNGSTYADSTIRGRSGSFTMDGIATGPENVPNLGDNGSFMTDFIVQSVPEPTALALAALSSLAALTILRPHNKRSVQL